nr:hypothetical protein asmbl_16 [uncultured bacterium]
MQRCHRGLPSGALAAGKELIWRHCWVGGGAPVSPDRAGRARPRRSARGIETGGSRPAPAQVRGVCLDTPDSAVNRAMLTRAAQRPPRSSRWRRR